MDILTKKKMRRTKNIQDLEVGDELFCSYVSIGEGHDEWTDWPSKVTSKKPWKSIINNDDTEISFTAPKDKTVQNYYIFDSKREGCRAMIVNGNNCPATNSMNAFVIGTKRSLVNDKVWSFIDEFKSGLEYRSASINKALETINTFAEAHE